MPTKNEQISARIEFSKSFSSKFDRDVKQEIFTKINSKQSVIRNNLTNRLKTLIKEAIQNTRVYSELSVSSRLVGELGLVDAQARLDQVIDFWIDNIVIDFNLKVFGSGFGNIKIGIIRKDFSDVLGLPAAEFITEKGVPLEWLRWLLLEGTAPIVIDYSFSPSRKGRTGIGIMVKRKSVSWSVPPQFAGTEDDNFVVRATEGLSSEIETIIAQEITKSFI